MNLIEHPASRTDRSALLQLIHEPASAEHVEVTLLERRKFYDAMTERTPHAVGVRYEAATVRGVPGVWCRNGTRSTSAILYLHGGAYNLGSAAGYRNFAGQIANRCAADVFVPDYRLAPENPFPAAVDDAISVYVGLAETDYESIALVGDSAGGGLALVTVNLARSAPIHGEFTIRGCVVFSPWTDLALGGPSIRSHAERDPILSEAILCATATNYLGGTDASDPLASPLYGDPSGLPALQLHVGTEEILLDDAVRYTRRANEAGVEATVHLWEGMPHVFPMSLGTFDAAAAALDISADFLKTRLA